MNTLNKIGSIGLSTSIKFGAAGGLCVLLYTQLLIRSGVMQTHIIGQYLGYLAIVIMPFCTYLAIKEVGNRLNREITLTHALITGLFVSLVAACIYSAFLWVEHVLFTDIYQEQLIADLVRGSWSIILSGIISNS